MKNRRSVCFYLMVAIISIILLLHIADFCVGWIQYRELYAHVKGYTAPLYVISAEKGKQEMPECGVINYRHHSPEWHSSSPYFFYKVDNEGFYTVKAKSHGVYGYGEPGCNSEFIELLFLMCNIRYDDLIKSIRRLYRVRNHGVSIYDYIRIWVQ